MKETTFYPSKTKHALLLLVSITFVAGGIWLAKNGDWMGHIAYVFFGLGVVVFTIQLLPNSSYLKLKEDGFEFSALFRRHYVKWNDIKHFGIMTQTHRGMTTNKMVGWDYREEFEGSDLGRKISKKIGGIESALPDTYGMKAEELLSLMDERLKRNDTEPVVPYNSGQSLRD
ncbi:STM3941 family protein [Pelagicoccus sp. SDUM812003]|uniref:STM3941 family protein n=1 Tax=Pelagicoccus sp. SDUM812003 TaxID=3041267 RepID=UPI00280CD861|nr:STM3941 family protein [Pelagicoccus sp. SDUM812003]MDQ8205777.1 STM3941 family protein [Pelagicoccus sp. SDUM812003]